MNTQVNLALIVTLVTILSTIASSWINKGYEMKSKKLELKYKHIETTYIKSLEVFQNFVSQSTKIIDYIDNGNKPNSKEIQDFENSCISCYLFLNENDRAAFQEFRIEIKNRLGYKDPRYGHPFAALSILAAARYLSVTKEERIFSSFNKCINATNKTIESLSSQLKEIK
ncbi:MAG: hypothetical protein ACTIN1_01710 [Pseudolactococcus laudensis]